MAHIAIAGLGKLGKEIFRQNFGLTRPGVGRDAYNIYIEYLIDFEDRSVAQLVDYLTNDNSDVTEDAYVEFYEYEDDHGVQCGELYLNGYKITLLNVGKSASSISTALELFVAGNTDALINATTGELAGYVETAAADAHVVRCISVATAKDELSTEPLIVPGINALPESGAQLARVPTAEGIALASAVDLLTKSGNSIVNSAVLSSYADLIPLYCDVSFVTPANNMPAGDTFDSDGVGRNMLCNKIPQDATNYYDRAIGTVRPDLNGVFPTIAREYKAITDGTALLQLCISVPSASISSQAMQDLEECLLQAIKDYYPNLMICETSYSVNSLRAKKRIEAMLYSKLAECVVDTYRNIAKLYLTVIYNPIKLLARTMCEVVSLG